VDGYDGEVLQGAKHILNQFFTLGLFLNGNPVLIKKAGQGIYDAFEALIESGYNRFLWFNNIGTFSHFSNAPNREQSRVVVQLPYCYQPTRSMNILT